MSSQPLTPTSSEKSSAALQRCLDQHFLACSALAGAAAMLTAATADASTVYSGPKNIAVPVNGKGLYLDFDTGTFSTTDEIAGFDLNFVSRASGPSASLNVGTGASPTNGVDATITVVHSSSSSSSSSSYTVVALNKLAAGKTISGKEKFAHGGLLGSVTTTISSSSSSSSTPTTRTSGAWGKGGTGYVGFEFKSAAGVTLYGWAQLAVASNLSTTVVDWAYENSGQPINTGQTMDTIVSIQSPRPTANEGGSPAKLKFVRTGDKTSPLEVHYKINASSTAKPGTDYLTLPGTITIPAGKRSVKLSVGAVDNNLRDGSRVVSIKLLKGYGYLVTKPKSASVEIVDND